MNFISLTKMTNIDEQKSNSSICYIFLQAYNTGIELNCPVFLTALVHLENGLYGLIKIRARPLFKWNDEGIGHSPSHFTYK